MNCRGYLLYIGETGSTGRATVIASYPYNGWTISQRAPTCQTPREVEHLSTLCIQIPFALRGASFLLMAPGAMYNLETRIAA